jgi:hypothetical protein
VTADQKSRVATAAGFLSGVLACLDALRDAHVVWPPDAAWVLMSNPHRLEFGAGVALIVVTIVVSLLRHAQSQ